MERNHWRRQGSSLRWRLPPLGSHLLPDPQGREQKGVEEDLEGEQEKPEERLPKETKCGERSSHLLPDPQGREEKGVERDLKREQ
jgi:hypothetical protein